MFPIRQSALSLVRCLTVVSLLLSVVPPSTYVQAAPVRASAPVQVNAPRPTPVPTSAAPATPTTFTSPLAPAGPTPTPAPVELAARPLLTVSAEPDSVAPYDVVTFSLTLFNPTSAPMSGQVLSATLPPTGGLRWIPGQAGLTFDAPSRRLTADIGQLAPGQAVTLTAQLQVTGPADHDAVLEVEARSGDTVLAQGSASVWVAQPARATIKPEGGKLQSADGRVTVEFQPPAAAAAGHAGELSGVSSQRGAAVCGRVSAPLDTASPAAVVGGAGARRAVERD